MIRHDLPPIAVSSARRRHSVEIDVRVNYDAVADLRSLPVCVPVVAAKIAAQNRFTRPDRLDVENGHALDVERTHAAPVFGALHERHNRTLLAFSSADA